MSILPRTLIVGATHGLILSLWRPHIFEHLGWFLGLLFALGVVRAWDIDQAAKHDLSD